MVRSRCSSHFQRRNVRNTQTDLQTHRRTAGSHRRRRTDAVGAPRSGSPKQSARRQSTKNRTLQLYGKVIPGRVRQPPQSGRQPTDSNSGDLGLPSRPKPRPRLRQGENITLGSGGVNGNIVSEWWDGHEAHSHT